MRNYKVQFVMAVLAVIVVLFGCSKKNDEQSVSENAIVAMGGSTALHAVTTQQITASGQLFEPEQTLSPNDPPRTVSSLQYTLTEDLSAGSFRYDWTRGVTYPFAANLAYSEVIKGNQGFVAGQDTANAAAVRAALPPVRLATLTKLHRLTSPLVLMRAASDAPQTVEARQDEQFNGKAHHVIALPGSVSPVRLFIDPDTFLPAKADTLEDDPIYGDTLYEVLYNDWRKVGDIMVPFRLTQNLTGLGKTITMQTEERTIVLNNVDMLAGTLDIPADLLAAYDPADALRGERMSQYFLRRQALGLPSYADQPQTVFTESSPGSGVWHVTGGSHNSLAVVMADHVDVVEPPLNEVRSIAVIDAIKSRFPGKPIRNIVVSHFHFDHSGGVRRYAAEGATVVVGAQSQAHFEAVVNARHSVVPDELQKSPRQVTVTAVPAAGLTLTDGVRTVNVYPVQNTHAADMVFAFVPGENLVFVSDLFSPPTPTVAVADIPPSLTTAFTAFGLTVNKIAGGHGAMAVVQ